MVEPVVRVVPAADRSTDTLQTPGMVREVAFDSRNPDARLENSTEAGEGDFVFMPAGVIHQEINASSTRPTSWVVVRSNPDPIVINLAELAEYAEAPAIEYAEDE